MINLKLNQKLIFFWLSSIIISILLFVGVFYYLQENFNQQKNQQKLTNVYKLLNKNLKNTHQHLEENAFYVASQENVISSFSLLHRYQDINNYQNIIFDTEKKKLNLDLVKLLKTTSAKLVAAYDGYNRLNSFAYSDKDNKIHTAYQSYSDKKEIIMTAEENSSDFTAVDHLPNYIKSSLHVVPTISGNAHIETHENHIALEAHVPIIREFNNGDKLQVGTISVIELLDTDYLQKISAITGTSIYLSIDTKNWLSSEKINYKNAEFSSPSMWNNLSTGINNWKMIKGNKIEFGIANYSIPNTDTAFHIIFTPLEDKNQTSLPLLQDALFVVLLFNLMLLPVGIYFLRKNIISPVAQLVNGVELLRNGEYNHLNITEGTGELAFLAKSFNEMAHSIHYREKEHIKLSLAVEQSPISMLITDIYGHIEYVNSAFCSVSGYAKLDVMGKNISLLKSGETSKEIYNQLWSTIKKGDKWEGVFHNKTKTGELIWESVTILPIKSSTGEIINYLALNKDITEIKHDKEQLDLQSAALLATADGVVITDIDGNMQWVNPAYEKLTGYSMQEAIGNNPRILNSGKQDDKFFSKLWDTILSGNNWHNELYNKHKSGKIYLEEQSITPVFDDNGNITHFIAIKRDITKQRNQERELQQSQKMDALGKLTGGVAHDYNNMLGIIIGYSGLLKDCLADDPKLSEFAEAIQQAGERGANLTKKLLTFSRQKTGNLSPTNINSLIRDNQLMLEKSLTARIMITYDFDEKLCDVFMDGNDFNDAILNMGINAMHAMPSGGQISIATKNINLDDNKARTLDLSSGSYAQLTITDTGTGMDQETQNQIFDPFFSTKGDKGTGLGMSQVYGFVKSMRGMITIKSEPGSGTQFDIYFPCYIETNTIDNIQSDNIERDLTGSEVILVVDDEVQLGNLTAEILANHGYAVLIATSAKQALDILSREPVDLVLTDIIMPETDGYLLALEIKNLYPNVKIQHISGYNDIDNADLEKHGFPRSLQKPLEAEEILKRVRELFNE